MPLTAAQFKDRFAPTFDDIDDSTVEEKLGHARRSLSETVLGDQFDDTQAYYAARLLALSPQGQEAGLRMGGGANQRTVYDAELERLMRRAGTAHRVVLD